MATIISRCEFFKLEEEIIAKFKRECKDKQTVPPSDRQKLYGYGDFNKGEHPCIRYFVSESPKVKAYLDGQNNGLKPEETSYKKINGKDLYDRGRRFKKDPNLREMVLDDIYEFVYFQYLECDSVEQFRKKYIPKEEAPATVTFRQFYYSYRNHIIKEAEITLLFTPDGIKSTQKGFLDQRKEVVLEGIGRKTEYCLRLSMESQENDLMDLYLHTQYKNPKIEPMLLGIFVAQSAHNFPVSVETILVRKDLELREEDILQIERFLFLKRHHFRSNDPGYKSFQELRVKKPLVNMIAFLSGKTYRVWSYTRQGDIVQVKFVVEQNYQAKLYSTDKLFDENDRVQTCLLHMSDAINQRLVITLHPQQGSGFLGTSILEIPNRLKANLFTGVTCGVGLRNDHPTISYIALLADNSDFEPDIIPHAKIKDYIMGNEDLQSLHRELEKYRFETKE